MAPLSENPGSAVASSPERAGSAEPLASTLLPRPGAAASPPSCERNGLLGSPKQDAAAAPAGGLSLGRKGLAYATHYGQQGLVALEEFVQQGPVTISLLCLVGGYGTVVCGLLRLVGLVGENVGVFGHVLDAYMVAFGLTAVVLETNPDALTSVSVIQDAVPHLLRAQSWLHEKAELLTEFHGRAAFYIYQGTLLTTQGCTLCLLFMVGVYNVFMGALCAWMAWDHARSAGQEGPAGDVEQASRVSPRLSEDELRQLEEDFQAAKAAYEREEKDLRGRAQLDLYGLLQQAEAGDCETRRPGGFLNSCAKAKWDAWSRLRGTTQQVAKASFVDRWAREHKKP